MSTATTTTYTCDVCKCVIPSEATRFCVTRTVPFVVDGTAVESMLEHATSVDLCSDCGYNGYFLENLLGPVKT